MTKSLRETISERRRILQNPYAYVDELEEIASLREERERLGNPYAYVDKVNRINGPIGRFDGISRSKPWAPLAPIIQNHRRYTDEEIESFARKLQTEMWERRAEIFPSVIPANPVDMLDAGAALGFLGYNVELAETLGQFVDGGNLIEVAGTIDKDGMQIRISRQFPLRVRNFTAAHELGHALLHETTGLHRDRPVDGISITREAQEYEADKFATHFLMPRKLVRKLFERIFGRSPFEINDETLFALFGSLADASRHRVRKPHDLSRILASARRYNGVDIVPLADQFRVSVEAMAIRLQELKLIALN